MGLVFPYPLKMRTQQDFVDYVEDEPEQQIVDLIQKCYQQAKLLRMVRLSSDFSNPAVNPN